MYSEWLNGPGAVSNNIGLINIKTPQSNYSFLLQRIEVLLFSNIIEFDHYNSQLIDTKMLTDHVEHTGHLKL